MRVRGHWPLREDRPIPLPIRWVHWLRRDGDGDDGGGGRGERGRGGNDHNKGPGKNERRPSGDTGGEGGGPVPGSSSSGQVFIPTNPFTNPAALQTLKESFAKQPNWKAAVMEGTTWEGNADENAAKWRKLNCIDA